MIFRSLLLIMGLSCFVATARTPVNFFPASDKNFQYVGRIDFTDKAHPRFWQPGVYITTRFKGSSCEVLVRDEVLWGKSHNYISIIIDNDTPRRIRLRQSVDTIRLDNLPAGAHTLVICKSTEAGIGYVEFIGLRCESLLPPPSRPLRKIEYFGNSITCGTGSDLSAVACDSGEWYDQHNAWESYGPLTARALNAQWHLSSVSGIGLVHSCCDMKITMPDVYDKMNMREGTIDWTFERYRPDVVTIALGQNDGIRDSLEFCTAYVRFITRLRAEYQDARIVCLTSPMADNQLLSVMKRYIDGVVEHMERRGDRKVSRYFFSRSFNSGCGGHPDLREHRLLAAELVVYLEKLMNW